MTEAAARLGVGRAVIYRLVGTLAAHGLVRRDRAGRIRLGAGLLQLARRAQPLLADARCRRYGGWPRTWAPPRTSPSPRATRRWLWSLVEPTWTQFHVAYRVGSRHALERGASGRAHPRPAVAG